MSQKTGSVTQTVAEIKEEGVTLEKNGFMKCERGKIVSTFICFRRYAIWSIMCKFHALNIATGGENA